MVAPPKPVGPVDSGVIVVCDDEPHVRSWLRAVLRSSGHQVVEVATAEELLTATSRFAVDLVLLDERLPGMTGTDAVRVLRSRPATVKTPIVMLSGAADLDGRIRALEAGADDFVDKPAHAGELMARVGTQLRRHHVWTREMGRLERRADAIARLLGHVERRSLEAIADALCAEMSTMHANVGAAVHTAFADGSVACVAARIAPGSPSRIHRAVPCALFEEVFEHGLVIEHGGGVDGPAPPGIPDVGSSSTAAYLPLARSGSSSCVLVVFAEAGHRGVPEPLLAAVATATDFASVGASLLAEPLRQTDEALRADAGPPPPFRAVFQPVVDLRTGGVVGYEALTRFDDGTPPDARLERARIAGTHIALEVGMAQRALEASRALPRSAWVAVNLSPSVIERTDVLQSLARLSGHDLVVELTEHEAVGDVVAIRDAIGALDGVRLSLDDAGAAYACLNHVRDLRPEFVKIDRSWISGIEDDAVRQALVGGLVSFTTRVGGAVIAEGIETESQLAVVRELGVPLGQGYLLGAPVDAP